MVNGKEIGMRKFFLIVLLLFFSSTVYGQATFPVTNKRIVTDVWCDLLATKLSADALYWQNMWKKVMGKDRDYLMIQMAHESNVYNNLCIK